VRAESSLQPTTIRECTLGSTVIDGRPFLPDTLEMKVIYDKGTDTLTITLREVRIRESDEVRPGVIADFGYDGEVVRFEILSASKVVAQPGAMAYELVDASGTRA
jgi:uncharacterized protein YuzE